MSPVPNAIAESRLGKGSPVTTTTCGSRPLRLRMRFNASDRAFCTRSLLIVHLQEIEAWSMGFPPFAARKLACRLTSSLTRFFCAANFRTSDYRNKETSEPQKAATYGMYNLPHPANNTASSQQCELDHLVAL